MATSILDKYKVIVFNKINVISRDETLPQKVIESFLDDYYYTGELLENIVVYRRFGGGENQAKLLGNFASTEALLSRDELAILKKWSSMQFEAEIIAVKGARLNFGKVAPQVGYSGGADQVLLPQYYPTNWVKTIKDLKTGKIYSFEEFQSAFPELIQ